VCSEILKQRKKFRDILVMCKVLHCQEILCYRQVNMFIPSENTCEPKWLIQAVLLVTCGGCLVEIGTNKPVDKCE
jgi:hypothetical protein